MSVVGIDFGNQSGLIAQAAKGGIGEWYLFDLFDSSLIVILSDVILNDSSNRQTA